MKNQGISEDWIFNINLYALEDLRSVIESDNSIKILNTVGYSNMNKIRERLHNECLKLGYEMVNYISARAICMSKEIGTGNIILPGSYIGTDVSIGDNNVIYAAAVLTHDIVVGNNNFIASNVTIGGNVTIGSNCFIGMGAIIKNRIQVADLTLVGAGTYVYNSTHIEDVIVPVQSIKLEKKSNEINLISKEKRDNNVWKIYKENIRYFNFLDIGHNFDTNMDYW